MLQNLIMYLVRARSCVMGFAKSSPELIYWKGLIIWFGIVRLEYKGVSLLSIFDALELRRIMCRGGIEGYCLPNGIGNIPWLRYFFAILLNMFYRRTAPLTLVESVHKRILENVPNIEFPKRNHSPKRGRLMRRVTSYEEDSDSDAGK